MKDTLSHQYRVAEKSPSPDQYATSKRSPMKSTRKQSSELGVPRSTMQDHMKKDLNVRPSLQQQRRFAQSCGRHLSHNYSKNAPTYVTEDMEAHPFVCPASRYTYGFNGHVTKAYVIQIKLR